MSAQTGSGLMENGAVDKRIATGEDTLTTEKSLHEKFVTYIQALTGSSDGQSSVWMEHSYARARRGGGAAPRTLLVRRGPACPDCHLEDDLPIDVDTVEEPPPPPLSSEPLRDDLIALDAGDDLENWEEELDALAPTPTHRRLAANVLELIRSLRTARLAGASRGVRAHARRLRRELAPLWSHPGPLQQRPAAWMHGALSGYLPRPYLELYNEMVSELARAVPWLVERLLAGQVAAAPAEAEATGPRVRPAADRPLLVWVPSGRDKRDALWESRLSHLMPVHRIKTPDLAACSPEAWCTAMGAATRAALASQAGVPRSALALGGWGAGAALAVHAAATWDPAAGDPPRCLVLLSMPLLTAEGPRDSLDDPLLDLKVPVLFVVGQNAMQCMVSTVEEVRSRMSAWSRLLVVGCADDALRLTHQKLRMERVTQQMVDAALAEEVRGFVAHAVREDVERCPEEADSEWEPPSEPEPCAEPPPPPHRRRAPPASAAPPPAKRRYGDVSPPPAPAAASPPTPASTGKGRGLALLRVSSAPSDSTLAHTTARVGSTVTDWEEVLAASETFASKTPIRNIRMTDGLITHNTMINGNSSKGYSVVARGTGSVPLCLPPPRRSAAASPSPGAAAAQLAPADIMQLPIVFADDDDKPLGAEPPSDPPTTAAPQLQSTVSVRSSGPLKYTKVILAKRAGGGGDGGGGGGGAAAARPIIVKGGLRIMPKTLIINRGAVMSPVASPKSPSKDKSPV